MRLYLFDRRAYFALLGLGLSVLGACGGSSIPRIAIEVEPLCVDNFKPGSTQQFNARLYVESVDQGIANNAVTWEVIGENRGAIDANGLYQAPDTQPPPSGFITIQATSKEDPRKAGQAQVVMEGQGNCAEL